MSYGFLCNGLDISETAASKSWFILQVNQVDYSGPFSITITPPLNSTIMVSVSGIMESITNVGNTYTFTPIYLYQYTTRFYESGSVNVYFYYSKTETNTVEMGLKVFDTVGNSLLLSSEENGYVKYMGTLDFPAHISGTSTNFNNMAQILIPPAWRQYPALLALEPPVAEDNMSLGTAHQIGVSINYFINSAGHYVQAWGGFRTPAFKVHVFSKIPTSAYNASGYGYAIFNSAGVAMLSSLDKPFIATKGRADLAFSPSFASQGNTYTQNWMSLLHHTTAKRTLITVSGGEKPLVLTNVFLNKSISFSRSESSHGFTSNYGWLYSHLGYWVNSLGELRCGQIVSHVDGLYNPYSVISVNATSKTISVGAFANIRTSGVLCLFNMNPPQIDVVMLADTSLLKQ